MKKILALVLLLSLMACKENPMSRLAQLWYFTEGDVTLDLKMDSTFVAEERTRLYNGTWRLSGDTIKLTDAKGQPIDFLIQTLEKDSLVVSSNGEEMYFRRLNTVRE